MEAISKRFSRVLFYYMLTLSEYEDKLNLIKDKYESKGLTLHPLVILTGKDNSNLESYFTYYDGILYKFTNLLKCVDSTSKLYVKNFY